MSSANVFKYENRLAKTLVQKGGMNADEAITKAQAAVEQVREPTITEIDAQLTSIYALGERLRAGRDEAALQSIYDASNRIIGTAGIFDLSELGKAAYSLCELISRFQGQNRFNEAMVRVHLDGLRLLRHPQDHSQAHRDQVLLGLRQVVAAAAA